MAAFRDSQRRMGWVEGRNIPIEKRWAPAGDAESLSRFASELAALKPDLILSHGTPTTTALLQQTRDIPIVFAIVSDPLGSGFVKSFSEPGGNVTGFIVMEPTVSSKWLELLKEIAPRELPVQGPIKFVMVINVKTAKALGLEVPLRLYQVADEIIE